MIVVVGKDNGNDDGMISILQWVCSGARVGVWGEENVNVKEDPRATVRLKSWDKRVIVIVLLKSLATFTNFFSWGFAYNNGAMQTKGKFLRSTIKVNYDLQLDNKGQKYSSFPSINNSVTIVTLLQLCYSCVIVILYLYFQF